MATNHAQATIQKILEPTGVTLNGPNPYDIQVHNERLYKRVLSNGSLGFGEAYMDGWWDAEQLDELMTRLLKADLARTVQGNWLMLLRLLPQYLWNTQTLQKARRIGERHYDIGNDLYKAMLDERMTYTCGYWKNVTTLDQAQEAKLDLVCRKIGLKEGDHVLDIGCGWGSFMKFAAERYGARVTGVTVSTEQVELGRKLCEGLPVEFQLKDYREVEGTYDHVISLGMIEHVGHKNYRTFMKTVDRVLKQDGLFLLHTIGSRRTVRVAEPWIEKYIFPHSMLPSVAQLGEATNRLFILEDWHNFGSYYDPTLMAWFKNFDSAWPDLKNKYDERFYRMWKFYLLSVGASFRARTNQLWQIVFSKNGVPGGYTSIR